MYAVNAEALRLIINHLLHYFAERWKTDLVISANGKTSALNKSWHNILLGCLLSVFLHRMAMPYWACPISTRCLWDQETEVTLAVVCSKMLVSSFAFFSPCGKKNFHPVLFKAPHPFPVWRITASASLCPDVLPRQEACSALFSLRVCHWYLGKTHPSLMTGLQIFQLLCYRNKKTKLSNRNIRKLNNTLTVYLSTQLTRVRWRILTRYL